MRVVGNYGTTLFDYVNSDKSIKEVLSKGATGSLLSAAAKKTLKENGITFDGTSSKDCSVYETIQTSAEDLRTNVIYLTNKEDDSLFAKAESTGDTSDIVKETEEFVSNYNAMVEAMNEMGGSKNTGYLKELDKLVKKGSALFEKIGITQTDKGTLNVDKEILSSASLEDLKAAFYSNEDLLDSIAEKSIYAEANAMSAKYTATISNYTSAGAYSDSALSSFIESI